MKYIRRLLRSVPGMRPYLVALAVLSTLAGSLIILQAHTLSRIVNGVFLEKRSLSWHSSLIKAMLLLLVIIVAQAMLVWLNGALAGRFAGHVKVELRRLLFERLLVLGPRYVQGERSGELVNTAVEGGESLDPFFCQLLPQFFLTSFVPLMVLIAVTLTDWLSGLVLILTAPLLPIFLMLVGTAADTQAKRQWQQLSLMSAHFLDVLQGLPTLKMFGRAHLQEQHIHKVSMQFAQTTLRVLRIGFLSSLVMEMGATICTAIVAVEIGLRVLYGQMDFGPALFVLLLIPEFYLPLRQLGACYHASVMSHAACDRIFAILETPLSAPVQLTQSPQQPWQQGRGELRFEGVSYSYDEQRPALREISFTIPSGKKVALVGPSGAGKSTLIQLLLRFLEPEHGRITINGKDLQALPTTEWCKQIAWVPQRPYLFNDTVRENIAIGQPDATSDEIIKAAKQAYAHEFIQALPQGYETIIGERGACLSGGQAQRLCLARAFLKNAPLLILDEATSQLDPETETFVLAATKQLMCGRTVLIAAHRLSTISDADQILVLDSGRIVKTGIHQILMQQSDLYKQLVRAYEGKHV